MNFTGRAPRYCAEPGCDQLGDWINTNARCPKHQVRGESGLKRRPMEKLYRCANYRDRFQPKLKRENAICQKLTEGQQCRNASTVCHHLREPKTLTEFYDVNNVVMLCAEHHPAGAAGTPTWQVGIDFVPTQWTDFRV